MTLFPSFRFWLAPDTGGLDHSHPPRRWRRLARCLTTLGQQATLIGTTSATSNVPGRPHPATISFERWRVLTDLDPQRDILVLSGLSARSTPVAAQALPRVVLLEPGLEGGWLESALLAQGCVEPLASSLRDPATILWLCSSIEEQCLLVEGLQVQPERTGVFPSLPEAVLPLMQPTLKRCTIAYRDNPSSQALLQLLNAPHWLRGWSCTPIPTDGPDRALPLLREALVYLDASAPHRRDPLLLQALALGCYAIAAPSPGDRPLMQLVLGHGGGREVLANHWLGHLQALRSLCIEQRVAPEALLEQLQRSSAAVHAAHAKRTFTDLLRPALIQIAQTLRLGPHVLV